MATPVYIQQTSTLNAQTQLVKDQEAQQSQLSSILTDISNLVRKVNAHEKSIKTLGG